MVLIADVLVENPTGPPSGIVQWRMELRFASKTIVAEIPLPSGKDSIVKLTGKPERIILEAAKYLPERTLPPIDSGGSTGGWFKGVFRGISVDDIYEKKPTLIISCLDTINHKRHSSVLKLGEGPRGITIPGE